jgi:predicted dehydrogenase
MGRAWGRNLNDNPDTEIVGWVDINAGAAEEAAGLQGLHNIVVTDDLGKAIADARPDFVVDVTIPSAHRDVTLTALAAGIPVIGEKPMAESMDDARAMVAASEKAGKLYMVSQSRRYDNRLRAYRELIREHLGGQLGMLNSDFYIGAHFGGFRDEMPSPLIIDMAIHTFDAARYLSGVDPVAVYCDEFNPHWSWYKGNASATAIFEMEGGLRYTYCGSWCSDGKPTSWDAEWRAYGPRGSAGWDGTGAPTADVVAENEGFQRKTSGHMAELDPNYPGGINGSLRDFVNALKTGATPMGECHDNIKSLAMVFAAVESARTQKRVLIKDVL